jgi:hypothetical protein
VLPASSDLAIRLIILSYNGRSNNRQLGFAGIALLWLFKVNKGGFYQLPHDLYWPAILLITGLGFDLIQYVLTSIMWGLFFRFEEKKRKSVDEDPDIEAPKYFPWPINVFLF